jgi:DNA end-binding protein Ku
MLKLAEHILDSKAADFDPAAFRDRYEEAVVEMLRRKQGGLPQPAAKGAPKAANVVNLMDALRRSLDAEGVSTKPGASAERRRPAAAAAGAKSARPAARSRKRA